MRLKTVLKDVGFVALEPGRHLLQGQAGLKEQLIVRHQPLEAGHLSIRKGSPREGTGRNTGSPRLIGVELRFYACDFANGLLEGFYIGRFLGAAQDKLRVSVFGIPGTLVENPGGPAIIA